MARRSLPQTGKAGSNSALNTSRLGDCGAKPARRKPSQAPGGEPGAISGQQRDIPIDLIDLAEWNAQEMSKVSLERLKREMRDHFLEPIQVVPLDNGRFRVIGGNHRVQAARQLGWTVIAALVLTDEKWQDEDLQQIVSVRLNVLRGRLDPVKFSALYQSLVPKYGPKAMTDLLAFTDQSAMAHVLDSVKKEIKKTSLPAEIQGKFDDKAKEAQHVDDLGSILNRIVSEYGQTLDQNFVVFAFGGRSHLYVDCTPACWEALQSIVEHCKQEGVEINTHLSAAFSAYNEAKSLPPTATAEKKARRRKSTRDVFASKPAKQVQETEYQSLAERSSSLEGKAPRDEGPAFH